MATSEIQSGGIASYTLKVNGSTIPSESRVYSINIKQGINSIPTALLTILDGEASSGTFKESSSDIFVPGAQVQIELGYDSQNKEVFRGIITKQKIKVNNLIGSTLEVECRDVAIKMIVGRKSMSYTKKTDSDIISSIIGQYSGLSSSVAATSIELAEQVQYYVSDWDFILSRAEANGLIVKVINSKISVEKPDADSSPVLTLEYGDNLLEFDGELNSVNQLGNVKAEAWDYKTQAIISGEASNDYAGAGNLSSKTLSEVVGLSEYDLQTSANESATELTRWSNAQLVKSEYSKIRATAKSHGSDLFQIGKYLTLRGLGDRFNGNHLISSVEHIIGDGNWTTTVNLGLSSNWITQEPDIMAPPAAGLLPGVRGLYNGTVKKIYEDPDNQYRVLIDLPLFDQNGEGVWARLANFYASSGAGAFFMPEVGDEVVLGFLNEDPRYPIILGSLYSNSKLKPHEGLVPNEKNSLKAIVSKSGIALKFDDENKVLSIATPKKNTIELSDKDETLSIQDQNGNSIVMSSIGVTIKSAKSLSLEAEEGVNIKGKMGVKIEAPGGDIELNGMNIKEEADIQYSANGRVRAQVQGGTDLTLKGAMVMIN